MVEMAIFALLIIPLPYTMKRKLFAFISESPIIAKLQYGLKVHSIPRSSLIKLPGAKSRADHVHLHSHSVH